MKISGERREIVHLISPRCFLNRDRGVSERAEDAALDSQQANVQPVIRRG